MQVSSLPPKYFEILDMGIPALIFCKTPLIREAAGEMEMEILRSRAYRRTQTG